MGNRGFAVSTDFWQHFSFRLDPWGADYEAPVQLDAGSVEAEGPARLDVERAEWAPVDPVLPALPRQIAFIDGRRRVDARVVGRDGGAPLYGVFATVAVGAVLVGPDRPARFHADMPVRRVLALGCGQPAPVTRIPCPLGSGAELSYDHGIAVGADDPQAPLTAVQTHMLHEEAALAGRLVAEPDTLVVRDGPLRYTTPDAGPVLGYVKTLHTHYLAGPAEDLLWKLPFGQRSPLFAIGGSAPRYSWYLRSGAPELAPEKRGLHGLVGIVRLEVSMQMPLAEAVKLADASCAFIPRYASHPSRDPRAPQNLTPVGALERELGRRMGDAAVVGRRLRHFLATLPR